MSPRPASFLLPLPLALLCACGSAPPQNGPALPGLEQLQADVSGTRPIVSSSGLSSIDGRDGVGYSAAASKSAAVGRLIMQCDQQLRAWNHAMAQPRDAENLELVQYTTRAIGVLALKNRVVLEDQAVSGATRNRSIACAALGFTADFRVTPLLLNGVSSGDPVVIAKSLLGLGVLADPSTSIAPIFTAVTTPGVTPEIESNAAYALFQIAIKNEADHDGTMGATLLELLRSPNPSVRTQACLSLGLIRSNLAVPQLTDLLAGDMIPDVRTTAAYALGQIGSTSSTAPLVSALNDPSELSAGAARAALVRIHGRDFGPSPAGWEALMP